MIHNIQALQMWIW